MKEDINIRFNSGRHDRNCVLYSPYKYRETEGIKDLGTNYWSQGRTQEIKERVVHLSIPQIDLRDGGREAGGAP